MAPRFAGILLLMVLAAAAGSMHTASAADLEADLDACNATIVSELSWLADALAEGGAISADNVTGLVTVAFEVEPEMVIAAMQLMRGETEVNFGTSSGTVQDGEELVKSYMNTKLTIINEMEDNSTLVINMGGGEYDVNIYVPRTIVKGDSTSYEGWNSAQSADVVAKINYLSYFGYSDTVRVEGGNPRIGYPWVTVGGVEAKLSENESKDITTNKHRFGAYRYNDYDAAKDLVVKVYA